MKSAILATWNYMNKGKMLPDKISGRRDIMSLPWDQTTRRHGSAFGNRKARTVILMSVNCTRVSKTDRL
jgi:hypothetical protein